MRVGIKKVQENEWLVHIGPASIKLDHFSVALLNITLQNMLALEDGAEHSSSNSYIELGLRIKELKALDVQKLLHELDNADLVVMMQVAEDNDLNSLIINNSGAILAKQLEMDLQAKRQLDEEQAKDAIRRIVMKMFELEGKGQIEFINENTQYI
ncbi:FliG C-terminal domain-containing protein [Thiomicrorhabdus sediminis]|uniref:Flagellar motor switch protein FliG C-terminal domain-containing protein n=1 Tax=Thiomicrorhabdus sediminis TaxID=2580412 RepID=A0A4P9K6W5_9GAMM|nr:FliG C-terminal domain-containing protein [Thiomicrorhabdus sediminis]QCU90822.1 hypothetical protein FE785_09375 [Thiomicrorhabdus sediminis]